MVKLQLRSVLSLTAVILIFAALLSFFIINARQSVPLVTAGAIILTVFAALGVSLLFFRFQIKPLIRILHRHEKNTLFKTHEQFAVFMDDLPLGVFIKDEQSRALYLNKYMDRVFSKANCIGKTPYNIFSRDIADRIAGEDRRVLAGENVIAEEVLTDKHGKERVYMTHKFCMHEGDKKRIGGISIEITLRKEAEYKLRILSKAIKNSPVCVLITDSEGHIEYVNPAFVNASGYSFAEVMGENMSIINSGHHPESFFSKMWEQVKSGGDWQGEILNKKKDGTKIWEFVSISPVTNNEGEITHFIAIKDDISKRKEVEEALRKAKEKAEQNDRLKTAFLANMSHEIRTPMNAIVALSGLLADPGLTVPEKEKYSAVIRENSEILLQLIEDIIDISKIEAGEITVRPSLCHINALMEEISDTFRLQVKESAKIRFTLDTSAFSGDVYTFADPRRLRQVISNLIGNAFKFTGEGIVEFGGRLYDGDKILFWVKDTGPGIEKEFHELIFDRFRQIDDSDTKSHRGAGLGLSISKSLVGLMGGTIWVDSEPGKGSCFCFTIPCNPSSSEEEAGHTDGLKEQIAPKRQGREDLV